MSISYDRLDTLIQDGMRNHRRRARGMLSCPKEEQIVLYLENRLSESKREALEEHMADCESCLDLIAAYMQAGDIPAEASAILPNNVVDLAKSLVSAPSVKSKSRFSFVTRHRWRYSLAWAMALLVVILLPFAYFIGKAALKDAVELRVQRILDHSGISVTGLDVGWGRILLNGIVLAQEGANPISVKKISFGFKPGSVLEGRLALDQLMIDSPYVRVGKEGLDVSLLVKKLFPEDLVQMEKDGLALSSSQVFVTNGSVDIVDDQVRPEPVIMQIEQMDLKIKGLSYPSAQRASVQLNGRIERVAEHGEITGWGEMNLAEKRLTLTIRLNRINMTALLPYYADHVSATVQGGVLDVEMNISLAEKELHISGKFMLRGLNFADEQGVFFNIPISLFEPYREQELDIPFYLSVPVNAGREYFYNSLLHEFETGLLEQVG
jgi:hypothetical protein